MMKLKFSLAVTLAAWTVGQGSLAAQQVEVPIVESSLVQVLGLQMEYFEFGDSGLPVVWIQDHHDMFRASTFGPEDARQWVAFLRRFSDSFRVIAPVRRGWGASEDPGYGFDVATQAEDVLGVLDALGIEKAVFVGRTIATQEVMWIAEHHPERTIGTVFLGTPFTTGTDKRVPPSPAVDRWTEMYNRACDVGAGAEADRRLAPRNSYRAHFYHNADQAIDVPALVVLHPQVDREGMNLRRLDRVAAGQIDRACHPETQAYFDQLAQDSVRLSELRNTFVQESSALEDVRRAMGEAFGDNLTMIWGDGEMGVEPWYQPMRTFLEGLAVR
jgi:pimeloyl-ACP methyl ester carboxylesterase